MLKSMQGDVLPHNSIFPSIFTVIDAAIDV
jgi:hypothetical protein